ncbi:MAG: PRC-barrel domain-containing protein [Bradyrhizobium sp.]|uniref:PRC-barrel domain-containing protein n=1 Tax=Bradyrhizobium sp. TaxID=376 RepID=UPI0029B3C215|nr:PRC-barrel domain-containing protein [Bradyrhizobium sp.]MDX3966868.1 PRC-barrel domain-containing protein [Bradyrhizobium sp.]
MARPPSGLPPSSASQQCLKDLQTFDAELTRLGFGVLPPGGYGASQPSSGYYIWGVEGTPRQKMRALRDAAYVYAWGGDEQSCKMVLGSMRTVYKEHQKAVGTEAEDPNVRTAWRRAHLARAKPVAEMGHVMRADILIGSDIRNLKDEKLGEVDDIVLNPEQRGILYVLASRGGFLGFGEKLVAIRWSDLRATEDHELYVLDVPAKAFEDAPAVDRRNFEKTADAAWQRTLGDYWESVLQK